MNATASYAPSASPTGSLVLEQRRAHTTPRSSKRRTRTAEKQPLFSKTPPSSKPRLRVLVDPPPELSHKIIVVTGKLKHGHTKAEIEAEVRGLKTVTYLRKTPFPVTKNCILVIDDTSEKSNKLTSFELAFGDKLSEHTMTSKQFFDLFENPEDNRKRKRAVTVSGKKESGADVQASMNVYHGSTDVASPMAKPATTVLGDISHTGNINAFEEIKAGAAKQFSKSSASRKGMKPLLSNSETAASKKLRKENAKFGGVTPIQGFFAKKPC